MAVALVATSTSGVSDSQATSRTVPVPTGAAAGMVAVFVLEMWQSTATNPAVTWPAGFNEIVNYVSTTDGFQKIKAAIKVLTGADSGTYNATWASTHWIQGQCSLWSGVDNTTPLDVAVALAQASTGTAYPANALTTANAGDGMVHLVANENSATSTPPTGYTEQQEANYLKTNTKIAGAAGSESISGGALSASMLKLAALIALRAAGGGGNSAPAGPATETDAAQSVGRTRASGAGQATETDTAQAAGRTRQSATSPTTETDTAQAIGRARQTSASPATEADTAQVIGRSRQTVAGPATETDTAQPITGAGGTPVTPAAETDQAQSIGRARSSTTAPAAETDVPPPVGRTRLSAAGTASETDQPQQPGHARVSSVSEALETDAAQPVGNPNTIVRDLDLTAVVEPARFRIQLEADRLHTLIEPARFRTEIAS